ncbi:hypothetical protein [Candidatus Binatus sp.]|uniref:hypothetical protein n=1 Tax=Candidatus Binatus sp. TaxID=2811406 RepID=UPI003BB05E54
MLSHYAGFFSAMQVQFTQMIDRLGIEVVWMDTPISQTLPSGHQNWSSFTEDPNFFSVLRTICDDIDLDSAVSQIDRLSEELRARPNMLRSQFRTLIEDLRNRIYDQLGSRQFLYVPFSLVPYWENSTLFGDEVFDKIPTATNDIFEAGSCFAVGRAGGTVYHCMGIMQAALFAVAEHLATLNPNLKIAIDLNVDDWGSVVKKIQSAVDGLEQQALAKQKAGDANAYPQWKPIESAYNELISDVNAVKKAWRHPHAHFRQEFTEEHARKILEKVGDFIKHAATLLPEVT